MVEKALSSLVTDSLKMSICMGQGKLPKRFPSMVVCGILIVAAAVVHGSSTHRWAALAPTGDRATRAHSHVIRFGDYASEDVPSELPVKERSSVTCRRYSSPSSGQSVTVSLTSGPPGAVATHTPDVCYPGSGFTTVREPTLETLDLPNGRKASFMVAEYEKKTATAAERHRIRWAWSVDGNWGIPSYPRFAFLNQPELFKIYVVTPLVEADPGRSVADNTAAQAMIARVFADYGERIAEH